MGRRLYVKELVHKTAGFCSKLQQNEKLGIASANWATRPARDQDGQNHTPLPRDYRATASSVQMSQKFINIQHYFQFDIV